MKLVKGFKVLFVDGADNAEAVEREAKIHIVRECLARMTPGDTRRFVVLQIADELGLAG